MSKTRIERTRNRGELVRLLPRANRTQDIQLELEGVRRRVQASPSWHDFEDKDAGSS